jgi:hypothetical protein
MIYLLSNWAAMNVQAGRGSSIPEKDTFIRWLYQKGLKIISHNTIAGIM